MDEAANWVRVAATSDLASGQMMPLEFAGRSLALYHLDDGSWHCTDNFCTHALALLTDGWLEGHVIECPLHAGQFDVRSGKGLCPPIEEDLQTYPVRIDNDAVMVGLPG